MEELSFCKRVSTFTRKWLFPILLAVAITIGLAWPYPGDQISSHYFGDYRILSTINVCCIFFVSGLQLDTSIIKDVLIEGSRTAFAYGLITILIITSCMGFVTYRIPFSESDFSFGLTVFSVVPTTLGTGITMVSESKGNTGLAIFLTVVTNMLGIVTVPYALRLIILTDKKQTIDAASLDQVRLVLGLVYQVLIPLTAGKIVQELVPSVRPWLERHKFFVKLIVCMSVALIVWQSVSRSAEDIMSIAWYSIFQLIAAGIILHLVFLSFNFCMATSVFKFDVPDRRCIIIMCSQKTLPITLAVISSSGGPVGSEGLMSIPPIIAHMSQILIDSYLQSVWGEEST